MNIDAHQHFWQYSPETHGWINEEMAVLKRSFLPEDLQLLLKEAGFHGCVAVQAAQAEAENDFLLSLADQYDFVKAVVGWVDLRDDKVGESLEKYAKHPRFKGIRHIVQDEPDDQFLLRDDFMRGIGMLSQFNLTYDVLIYTKQLPAAIEFVGKFPDLSMVLDHIAKPQIAEGKLEPWATQIRELAQYSNLMCKLSGMVTEADWKTWKVDDFKPYLEVVFDAFGADRLMIGSDWPVSLLAADYSPTIKIITDFMAALPESDQQKIKGGNAARFYEIA